MLVNWAFGSLVYSSSVRALLAQTAPRPPIARRVEHLGLARREGERPILLAA